MAAPTEIQTETRPDDKLLVAECPEPLVYKTWVLKVSIHCEGCKRKIKKILTNIDGVYTTNIDLRQQKVVVTGNIEAETLIKKIAKAGRHAELWPEYSDPKPNKKPKKKDKDSDDDESSGDDDEGENAATGVLIQESKPEVKQVVTFTTGGQSQAPPDSGGAKKKNKKKKKRKKKNNSGASEGAQVTNAPAGTAYSSPLDHHGPPSYPTDYYKPPTQHCGCSPASYAVSHNTAYPRDAVCNTSYYKPPPSYHSYGYAYAGSGAESPPSDYDSYADKASDSFELFSDGNMNACCVM